MGHPFIPVIYEVNYIRPIPLRGIVDQYHRRPWWLASLPDKYIPCKPSVDYVAYYIIDTYHYLMSRNFYDSHVN